jgi:hypothetical protein
MEHILRLHNLHHTKFLREFDFLRIGRWRQVQCFLFPKDDDIAGGVIGGRLLPRAVGFVYVTRSGDVDGVYCRIDDVGFGLLGSVESGEEIPALGEEVGHYVDVQIGDFDALLFVVLFLLSVYDCEGLY